ncbi:MAG TPA: hypothetical protein PKV73_16455 [Agriterribacter sp.]|nr:hypothetical protein [Agriterribacter sp.]
MWKGANVERWECDECGNVAVGTRRRSVRPLHRGGQQDSLRNVASVRNIEGKNSILF